MSRVSRYDIKSELVNCEGKRVWNAGLYIRLSKEDIDKHDESLSIQSQKMILNQYVSECDDIQIYKLYVDEDYCGGNFDRPSFVEMKQDIEHGVINCFIVKDLSRFGRDVVYTKQYLQREFKQKKVRIIVLNDDIDSYYNPSSLDSFETNFKIIYNNNYIEENSQKIKNSLNVKKKKGEFIGAFPPYGYLRSDNEKNKLVIDEQVSFVVKEIYQMYIDGMSQSAIARELNKRNVLSPASYLKSIYKNIHVQTGGIEKQNLMWCASSIKNILTKEVYVGNLVQSKSKSVSPTSKKVIQNEKENWIKVENTHESIIEKEKFELVQQLLQERSSDKLVHAKEHKSLFSGFVVCGDCGYNMSRKKISEKNNKYCWKCSRHIKNKDVCSKHFCREDDVYNAVFHSIKNFISFAVDVQKMKRNKKQIETKKVSKIDYDLEINKYVNKGIVLYDKYKNCLIEKQEYLKSKLMIDNKVEELKTKKENECLTVNDNIVKEEISKVVEFKNIRKLTRSIVETFIEKILIFENNEIEIKFKFSDLFKNILLKNAKYNNNF